MYKPGIYLVMTFLGPFHICALSAAALKYNYHLIMDANKSIN